jgi:hypothetical protein
MSTDETWQPARLIPVSGLSNTDEQERRGASALLAVMQSVKEYGRSILQIVGAPAGRIETYIEVPFEVEGISYRPDGLIRVRKGASTWTALVEVKVGKDKLVESQIKAYLEIARQESFDAVITISNELATMGGMHPLSIDKRLTKKVPLHHISWSLLHAEALIERVNQSVAVTEQAWILSEFIRYLEYPRSGAVDFDDMGPSWVQVRDAGVASTLRANDQATRDVVDRFSQLTRYVAMNLSSQLGVQVRRVLSRQDRNNPGAFIQNGCDELATTGRMKGSITVPNAASPIDITVDLRSGRISCSVTLVAPSQNKPRTRVSWLLRQTKDMPPDLVLTANGLKARDVGPALRLDKVIDNPDSLLPHPKFDVRSFTLTLSSVAGSKRGQGKGSFVGSVVDLVNRFYEIVVQDLKPWSPPAPKVTSVPVVPTSQGGQPAEIPPSLAGVMPESIVPIEELVPPQPPSAPPIDDSPSEPGQA